MATFDSSTPKSVLKSNLDQAKINLSALFQQQDDASADVELAADAYRNSVLGQNAFSVKTEWVESTAVTSGTVQYEAWVIAIDPDTKIADPDSKHVFQTQDLTSLRQANAIDLSTYLQARFDSPLGATYLIGVRSINARGYPSNTWLVYDGKNGVEISDATWQNWVSRKYDGNGDHMFLVTSSLVSLSDFPSSNAYKLSSLEKKVSVSVNQLDQRLSILEQTAVTPGAQAVPVGYWSINAAQGDMIIDNIPLAGAGTLNKISGLIKTWSGIATTVKVKAYMDAQPNSFVSVMVVKLGTGVNQAFSGAFTPPLNVARAGNLVLAIEDPSNDVTLSMTGRITYEFAPALPVNTSPDPTPPLIPPVTTVPTGGGGKTVITKV